MYNEYTFFYFCYLSTFSTNTYVFLLKLNYVLHSGMATFTEVEDPSTSSTTDGKALDYFNDC